MSVLANDLKMPFRSGNVLIQLIIVNVAVFLLLNIFRLALFFMGHSGLSLELKFYDVMAAVAMPMTFEGFIYTPWTIVTYMFAQVDIFHILFNMLFLYFFGNIIQHLIGYSRTLSIYIYGGLTGAILTLILHSTVPVLREHASILIGASGSVMAIVVAAATLAPEKRIYLFFLGEIKLVYIALFYVGLDLVSISYAGNVGHICHLGGALLGFVYIRQLQNGRDFSRGFNRVFYGTKDFFQGKRRPKMKVVKNAKGNNEYGKVVTPKQGSATSKSQVQARIDSILDKISKAGYESLSKEEKDYLFRHGKDV